MHSRTALGIMAFAKEVSPSTPSTEDNHTQGLAITHTLSSSLQTQVKHAMLSIWGGQEKQRRIWVYKTRNPGSWLAVVYDATVTESQQCHLPTLETHRRRPENQQL